MFTLISLGTGTAYLYSVVATFAPDLFPVGFRMMGGTLAVYYEAAAVITVLVLLGQVLELRARDQTGGAIRALLNLSPIIARRLRPGVDDEEITLDHVQVGDQLRVRAGDRVRSTARYWTAKARWTNQWLRASRCPPQRGQVIRSLVAP